MGSSSTVLSAQEIREAQAIIAREEASTAAVSAYNRNSQPAYAPQSQAQQEYNGGNSGGTIQAFAHSGPAYPNTRGGGQVQRFGIGGSPAEGDDRGRGFGQKAGGFLGSIAGAIFKPANAVGNFGVNTLRGIEDSTGIQGLGVGFTQNPGRAFGRRASNFSFNGSFNAGGGSSYNSYSRNGGSVYADRNVSVRASEQQTPGNSGYFNDRTSLFGTDPNAKSHLNVAGVEGVFNRKDTAGAAFLTGYKNAVRDADALEKLLDQAERSNGDRNSFAAPESVTERLNITQSVLEAAMNHAAKHPEDYKGYMYTHIAGQEYLREVGESASPWKIRPVQDKETMDAILIAYGEASATNKALQEFKAIVSNNSFSERDLRQELDNFTDKTRWATYSKLDPNEKRVYNDLATKKFTDPDAYATQYKLLTHASIWSKGEGVVTDKKDQAFGIYQVGNGFVLRVKDDSMGTGLNKSDIKIPADKLEETFALVGKLSLADLKKDADFKEVAPQVISLVKGYGTGDGATSFVDYTEKTIVRLDQKAADIKAEADRKAQEAKQQEEAEKQKIQQDIKETEKEIKTIDSRLDEIANSQDPFETYLPGDDELLSRKTELLKKQAELKGEEFDPTLLGVSVQAEEAQRVAAANNDKAQEEYNTANFNLTVMQSELKGYQKEYDAIDLIPKPSKLTEWLPPVLIFKGVKENLEKKELVGKIAEVQGKINAATPEVEALKTKLDKTNEIKSKADADKLQAQSVLPNAGAGQLAAVEAPAQEAALQKPNAQQIERTADDVISALRTSPIIVLGESFGEFDAATTKQELVSGLQKYDPSQGSEPIDKAIAELENKLKENDVPFDTTMRAAIVRTVKDNLDIDLSEKLLSYNGNNNSIDQQALTPNLLQNPNAGQTRLT